MTDRSTESAQGGSPSSSDPSQSLSMPDKTTNENSSSTDASLRFSTNMAEQAQKWAKIQQKTFTNWCNDNLKTAGTTVSDLSTDLEDGIILIKLVEVLSGRKVGRYHKKVKNKPQKLENVAKALKAIAQDTVQLVNIGKSRLVHVFEVIHKTFLIHYWTFYVLIAFTFYINFNFCSTSKVANIFLNINSTLQNLFDWPLRLLCANHAI